MYFVRDYYPGLTLKEVVEKWCQFLGLKNDQTDYLGEERLFIKMYSYGLNLDVSCPRAADVFFLDSAL